MPSNTKAAPVIGIGTLLTQGRTALGLSQRELADKLSVTPSALSPLERGLADRALGLVTTELRTRVAQSANAGELDVTAAEALSALQAATL